MCVRVTSVSWPLLGCSQVSSAPPYIIRLMQGRLMVLAMQHELANGINCEWKVWKWAKACRRSGFIYGLSEKLQSLRHFLSVVRHCYCKSHIFDAISVLSVQTNTCSSRTSRLSANCLSHSELKWQLPRESASHNTDSTQSGSSLSTVYYIFIVTPTHFSLFLWNTHGCGPKW